MRSTKSFCYSSILTIFLLNYLEAYHEVPPKGQIEVLENEYYQFGIEEDIDDDAIIICYYHTDTGVSKSFEVTSRFAISEIAAPKNLHNPYQVKAEFNVIMTLGDQGLCQISVENVNSTGPKTWTLTPTVVNLQGKERNLTDSVFNVQFFYKSAILTPIDVKLLETASFYNHLILDNINLTSCHLRVGNASLELDLESATVPKIFVSPYSLRDEEITEKLMSLGEGLCGFRLVNASYDNETRVDWTLTAGDDHGWFYRNSFASVVYQLSDSRYTNKSEILGTEVVLKCGEDCNEEFCTLFNPAGAIVSTRNCTLEIDTLSMEHLGKWKCYCENKYAMESLEYIVEMIGKDFTHVETWQKDFDDYLNIGCRMANHQGTPLRYCKMTAPNQRTYNIRPTLATDRYTTLGSDYKNGICSLEIKKPLLDDEKGEWKCEIVVGTQEPEGAVIKIGEVQMPDYPRYLKVTTQLEKPFTISCEVPYSSEYCRITAPNGTRLTGDKKSEATLGRCSITVERANSTDNGTWVCSFARETGLSDDQIFVEVFVAEVLSYYRSIEVDSDDSADLICSSGYPLLYCRFISPLGVSYHIQNHHNSSSISYYGKGVEYGECGITITNVKSSDHGYWTCVTRLAWGKDSSEISVQILLSVTGGGGIAGSNLAGMGIGIAVAIVVISSIIGFVAMKKWKRREHAEVEGTSRARRPADDDSSSNNSETVFSRGPPPRSYTNPEPVSVEMEDQSR